MSQDIKSIWVEEAEKRIIAYEKGLLKTVSAKDVFAKYKKVKR
jgi:hypothetical protein